MTENLAKRPSKGILKSSSSFEKPDAPIRKKHKETKWDEMNIIATLHPPDKDYGHMKIEEPKTPYNWAEGVGDQPDSLDADVLAEKIKLGAEEPPKSLAEESDSEEDIDETPEEREKRKVFESKRKAHYNEYHAVKLARQLMSTEEDDEEEEETPQGAASDTRQPSTSRSPPEV
ncbi:protein phosphatase inhibitor 2-like [Bacillus rossius redtenbacheri]|uniref:protein phosphatase inhibitor 2-like n=1 Tax=Bacillus rossius redtenbacheri TaxID=93214 RepID=UPI002FDD7239